ncbi:hypothetical protein B0H13DRAFT_1909294 [Mycena leptocephala]|nr:hypothetical protein B0H13DRAFT_1909294 [Mycena leptocephala]
MLRVGPPAFVVNRSIGLPVKSGDVVWRTTTRRLGPQDRTSSGAQAMLRVGPPEFCREFCIVALRSGLPLTRQLGYVASACQACAYKVSAINLFVVISLGLRWYNLHSTLITTRNLCTSPGFALDGPRLSARAVDIRTCFSNTTKRSADVHGLGGPKSTFSASQITDNPTAIHVSLKTMAKLVEVNYTSDLLANHSLCSNGRVLGLINKPANTTWKISQEKLEMGCTHLITGPENWRLLRSMGGNTSLFWRRLEGTTVVRGRRRSRALMRWNPPLLQRRLSRALRWVSRASLQRNPFGGAEQGFVVGEPGVAAEQEGFVLMDSSGSAIGAVLKQNYCALRTGEALFVFVFELG